MTIAHSGIVPPNACLNETACTLMHRYLDSLYYRGVMIGHDWPLNDPNLVGLGQMIDEPWRFSSALSSSSEKA
jgi:hypothetical protein